MLFISNDKTVRTKAKQNSKDSNSQSLATQAKKRERLVPMCPFIRRAFDIFCSDVVALPTENETIKNRHLCWKMV